jgi:dynein heavy chain
MKATDKEFTPPLEDPNMTLGQILALHLHEFSADVEEICDQAVKEAKMEAGLVVLEEYWCKVEWFADMYKSEGFRDVVSNITPYFF